MSFVVAACYNISRARNGVAGVGPTASCGAMAAQWLFSSPMRTASLERLEGTWRQTGLWEEKAFLTHEEADGQQLVLKRMNQSSSCVLHDIRLVLS